VAAARDPLAALALAQTITTLVLIVIGHGNILDREAPECWMREAHLTKPFDATAFRNTVAGLIGRT